MGERTRSGRHNAVRGRTAAHPQPRQTAALREAGRATLRALEGLGELNEPWSPPPGCRLRRELEAGGWSYADGSAGPPRSGLAVSECYPYTPSWAPTCLATTGNGRSNNTSHETQTPDCLTTDSCSVYTG